jgi:hypothetical protein
MQNWKLNYYKKVLRFVQLQIKELESKGQVCDAEPLDAFLQECKEKLPHGFSKGGGRGQDLNFEKGFLSFDNLLKHIGRNESSDIFEIPAHTVKSYMYGYRQPTPNQMKKFIKLTNGSLIYESFFNKIDSPPFVPK